MLGYWVAKDTAKEIVGQWPRITQLKCRLPRRRADAAFRKPMRASRVGAFSCGNRWESPGRSGSRKIVLQIWLGSYGAVERANCPAAWGETYPPRSPFYRDCGATVKKTLFLKFETVASIYVTHAAAGCSGVRSHLPCL